MKPVIYTAEDEKAQISAPLTAVTSVKNIRPIVPPAFGYGEEITLLEHPEQSGTVREIVWHSKKMIFYYKLYINGRKKSRRYEERELVRNRKE